MRATIHKRPPRLSQSQQGTRVLIQTHLRDVLENRNALQDMIKKTREGVAKENLKQNVRMLNQTIGSLQSSRPSTLRRPSQ